MSLPGLQLIYRLQTTIRLLIDYRTGVDSFNFYVSTESSGTYSLIGSTQNTSSKEPGSRGKILYEFNVGPIPGLNWDNTKTHYLKIAPVINNVEQTKEGPLVIPNRYEYAKDDKHIVSFGFNSDEQRFIPIAVDIDGKVKVTNS